MQAQFIIAVHFGWLRDRHRNTLQHQLMIFCNRRLRSYLRG